MRLGDTTDTLSVCSHFCSPRLRAPFQPRFSSVPKYLLGVSGFDPRLEETAETEGREEDQNKQTNKAEMYKNATSGLCVETVQLRGSG